MSHRLYTADELAAIPLGKRSTVLQRLLNGVPVTLETRDWSSNPVTVDAIAYRTLGETIEVEFPNVSGRTDRVSFDLHGAPLNYPWQRLAWRSTDNG